jgi:DNA-binding transcriptional regulator YhcF (GntR family)
VRTHTIDYAALNPRSPVPMAEQIYLAIRRAIAERQVKIGDYLPPVREVAEKTGMNMNTVARVYRRLCEEGLLDGSRGRGTQILAHQQLRTLQRTELKDKVRDLLADAALGGLSKDTVLSIIERMEPPRPTGNGRRKHKPA